uniref:Carboxylic ester hydrolase n=1 Tax=Heliothis viriplaca TaxID=542985 RepID=L7R4S7_9NEOP|nr:juvenile hormone esterase [Heliothis viriplaca]
MTTYVFALAFLLHACTALAWPGAASCSVRADLDSGTVCGVQRSVEGSKYASFPGVPYAKQPLGDLRFKELEPPEHWDVLQATNEGPICFQADVLYGRLMQKSKMSEACIHANIHVPLRALPLGVHRPTRQLETISVPVIPEELTPPGLPILVFIHGGGFAFGSGHEDLHGPEYLVSRNIIVITFNYRLNVFGFLSMNTTKIPGNAGLRDQVTLLRWVQRNAKNFGGDPNDVTIAGQSAGAAAAHLLTLSKATEGLFQRAILMSGTGISSFYSSSPAFAAYMSKQLLLVLGITATDPDEIHQQLIDLPAEKLNDTNAFLLEQIGLTTFVPTVESPLPGVTTIIDDDPESLIAKGRGKNIPLLIGFTSSECETFRNRLTNFDLVKKIQDNPTIIIPPKVLFMTPPELLMDLSKTIDRKYYNGTISIDNFLKSCSDGFYEYPALKLAQKRAETGGAPLYLYRFAYEGQNSVIKAVTGLNYEGVGHIEDLTYVFRANSVVEAPDAVAPSDDDVCMKNLMTDFFVNFMTCSKPICEDNNSLELWPANDGMQYEDIVSPTMVRSMEFSSRQQDIIEFFDSLTSRSQL